MIEKGIIIHGSGRSHGNTMKACQFFSKLNDFPIIDLQYKNIGHFDYDFKNDDDDFIPLIESIISMDYIIFASPVYWYSMSGRMKIFFDRITDLLNHRGDLGQQLKGKKMGVISCSSQDDRNSGFIEAFQLSASYLHMSFIGDAHTWLDGNSLSAKAQEHLRQLNQKIAR